MSPRGRKNLPVGSSTSSWAGAPAILDDTADWRLQCPFARRNRSCALSSTAPPSASGSIESTELIQVFVRGLRQSISSYRPHTEAVGSSTQMRCASCCCRESRVTANQDNEDNPNINAHQSSPLMGKSTIDTIHEVRLKQFCARLREGLSRPESTSFAILPGCRLKLGNLFQSDGEQFGGLVACAAGLEWSRLPACVFVRLRPLTKSPSSRERQKRLG